MILYQGKFYARVSEVLQPLTNFDGIDPEVLSRKAGIGTKTHQAIQDYLQRDVPIVGAEQIGYFQSFKEWWGCMRPEFLEAEIRLYDNTLLLTGCIDVLVKLKGEEKAVMIDWKTSVQESPTWALQAHLYGYLLATAGKEVQRRYLFVKLDKEGHFPTVYEYKFNPNTLQRGILAVKEFWKKNVAINS